MLPNNQVPVNLRNFNLKIHKPKHVVVLNGLLHHLDPVLPHHEDSHEGVQLLKLLGEAPGKANSKTQT